MELIFIIPEQDKELEGKTASVSLAIAVRTDEKKQGVLPEAWIPPQQRVLGAGSLIPVSRLTLPYSLTHDGSEHLLIPRTESLQRQQGQDVCPPLCWIQIATLVSGLAWPQQRVLVSPIVDYPLLSCLRVPTRPRLSLNLPYFLLSLTKIHLVYV